MELLYPNLKNRRKVLQAGAYELMRIKRQTNDHLSQTISGVSGRAAQLVSVR